MSAPILVVRFMANQNDDLDSIPVEWIYFHESAPVGAPKTSTLDALGSIYAEYSIPSHSRLVLIVPAEDVVLTRVQVPLNQKRKRRQLVPYILEEYLNQSVSEVFFATQWLIKSADVGVAYGSRAYFDLWIKILDEQNLKPDAIYPEQYLLPSKEGRLVVLYERNRVLVRQDHWVASVAPSLIASDWVTRIAKEVWDDIPLQGQFSRQLRVDLLIEQTETAMTLAARCESKLRRLSRSLVELNDESDKPEEKLDSKALAKNAVKCESNVGNIENKSEVKSRFSLHLQQQVGLNSPQPIRVKKMALGQPVTYILASEAVRLVVEHSDFQLLQGDYNTARRKRKSKYKWQVAASLFGLFVVVQLSKTGVEYYAYQQAYLEAKKENVTLFKAAFPNVTQIRGSLRRALSSEKSKQSNVGSNIAFLELMMSVGETLSSVRGLAVKRMAYDTGQNVLRVDLKVADYPELEALQKRIEAKSFQVKIDGATQDNSGVEAKLRILVS